jgi:hypothetical protein
MVMKFRSIFLAILFCGLCQVAAAQEKTEGWVMFDLLEDPNCEYLLARLDYLVIEISKTPQAIAHMVVHKGPDPIKNQFYRLYLNKYLASRKLDRQRFLITTAKGGERLMIGLRISLEGNKTAPDVTPEEISLKLESAEKPVLFIDTSAEVVKVDGKRSFFDDCHACCIESLNLGLLSEFLEANPRLSARIRIGGADKYQALRLLRLVRADLASIPGLKLDRIRFFLGKRDEGMSQWARNISSIKVELVRSN